MRPSKRNLPVGCLAGLVLAAACGDPERSDAPPAEAAARPATFIGREVCAGCHQEQHARWRGSHHDLAMQEATEETVLGDFDGETFTYAGTTTTFFRQDGGFFVRTDGPDGELEEYEVAYAFGARPLQQYLIAFPGGRYQALSVVWDARPAEDGGRRWYHLYPDEAVDHTDPLHWTGVYQRWNPQCAECHSTDLRKNYDLEADVYATTFSEIDVSCEACHGPGSAHAELARRIGAAEAEGEPAGGLVVDLEDRSGGVWQIDPETGIAARSAPLASRAEVEACGRCHARRSPLTEDYEHGRPLLDTHRLALLDEGLYHADGQMLDEVYVYGSFLQSRMHRAGVTCTDCHDPHALEIPVADATCERCHLAAKFAARDHHFHEPGTAGASCVACHMPERVYMGVDARRDHGFRVPRPDLALELGTPDACTGCHAEDGTAWAAAAYASWYGDVPRRPSFARALDAGRRGLPRARGLLAAIVADPEMPGIARATALAELARFPRLADLDLLRAGLSDPDPLVRFGAVLAAEGIDPPPWAEPQWVELLAPLVVDPVRAVRIEAGRVLGRLPSERLADEVRAGLGLAAAEYVQAQEAVADRPEGRLNLALLDVREGRPSTAEKNLRAALSIDPSFAPAWVNLADLHRAAGREADAEAVLRDAFERLPGTAAVRHALGLSLVRQGRHDEALEQLARAAELDSETPRHAYVYGVALHSRGGTDQAVRVLADAHRRHPADPELLAALATIHRDAGHTEAALDYARRLLALRPDDPGARRLAAELGG